MSETFKKTEKQEKVIRLLKTTAIHILLFGGSRSGKTFILLYAVAVRALMAPGSRHLVLRRFFKDVRQSIGMDTFPKVMKTCFPGVAYKINKSDWIFTLPNGAEIWLAGLDDAERAEKILGKEYSTIYFNESSQMDFASIETALTRLALISQKEYNGEAHGTLVNKALYDCNPSSKAHWSYKQFISGLNPKDNKPLAHPEHYVCEKINPIDNAANLPPGYIEQFLEALSERQRKRFLNGQWLDDLEGALWIRSMIDKHRIVNAPPLQRIVIGVDPAVTANEDSDMTGIVTAGVDYKGHFFILSDDTIKGSPLEWAEKVKKLYNLHHADRVIAEVNNGGDLVIMNLRAVEKNISCKAVRATRGKITRAEPIAALYEQGLVHHVGEFGELEDQMCNYSPATATTSPDRMDALVWALTELSASPGGNRAILA